MSITKREAQALWSRLRLGLLGVERDIKEIVETPKPYEIKKRRRIARRKEEKEWKREIY